MNNKTIIILLGLILLALIRPVAIENLGSNDLNDGVTHTVVSISTTATGITEALAANYGVAYRRLQNVGNTEITCQLDDATSTLAVGTGIVLNSSTTNSDYEINLDNLYKGKIRCISGSSTGTLSVVER